MTNTEPASRIDLVDSLRAFAVLAIMLLHNIEHFDFYYLPKDLPPVIKSVDSVVWDTLFFLFAGKAYGIFALLFGFTFYLQISNQRSKGVDFRLRFMWRLFLLLIFGFINTMFYEGDILSFYAVLGIALVPMSNMSDRTLLVTALVLLFQPFLVGKAIYIFTHPAYQPDPNLSDPYFAKIATYLAEGSFFTVLRENILNGKPGVFFWFWENGRFLQTPALFMIGVVLGRQQRFCLHLQHSRFWLKVLVFSLIAFVPLYLLRESVNDMVELKALARTLRLLFRLWSNIAFMFFLVALFVLLYSFTRFKNAVSVLNPVGRMSLTNYIMQSILGSFVYYGFGLGMYQYTGATYALFIGIALFILQLVFCRWWLSRYKQGPLEHLWSKATWIKTKVRPSQ
ncbi:DUF418 domain-containing protein [Pedobacter sp. SYSU D00535]|uniref:DUF418 domain-containing protein n=1 Tax=Pedobacter sp. SYSU D00535 TaxID=2810308 RepID=UPI001A95C213|nr:DUF418 domain-containing protein [Pedobacter sp. SYSU D00535]